MINSIITKRRSTRAFSDKKILGNDLIDLFEAARWAPSAHNKQPWSFIIGDKEEKDSYNKILSSMQEGNKMWADNAPVLILVLAKVENPKDVQNLNSAYYNTALAVANLTFEATSKNIDTHQIGGFDRQKIKEDFKIPDDYVPVVIVAAGYKGDINKLPDFLKERELADRERMNLEEFVFSGKLGKSYKNLFQEHNN